MSGTQMDAATQRLDRLQRENRRWKVRGATLVLLLAVAMVLMAQAWSQKEIRAEKFVLQDSSGKELATLENLKIGNVALGPTLYLKGEKSWVQLSALGDSPMLALSGAKQGKSISLSLTGDRAGLYITRDKAKAALSLTDKDGPGVVFFDTNGKLRAVLAATPDKTTFELKDLSGKGGARLSVNPKASGLLLHDVNAKVRAALVVTPDGPLLELNDTNEKGRAGIAVSSNGPGVILRDANGKNRAVLGVTSLKVTRTGETRKRPASSLVLFDKTGKVIWSIP